jgi:hypothetical protein
MTVINVLYLPRDDRLRLFVRLALDFVEEVYRDDVLSDLKFVSFTADDEFDEEQVKYIIEREGFAIKPKSSRFYWPHYDSEKVYAWVPVSTGLQISELFRFVVHEVTHHAIHKLPVEDKIVLTMALRGDLGAKVDEMIRRYPSSELVKHIALIVDETVTLYIVDNYFKLLEREPKKPTHLTGIHSFAGSRYYIILAFPPSPKHLAEVLSEIYWKTAFDDLPNYRRAIHETFLKITKKLPVDVLESNRAKYEILYREEPIIQSF